MHVESDDCQPVTIALLVRLLLLRACVRACEAVCRATTSLKPQKTTQSHLPEDTTTMVFGFVSS